MTTDDRLAAIVTDAAKMLRYQVDRLDEIHLLLDERLPKPTDWENGIPTFRDEDVEWACASCGEAMPTWQHECPDVTVEPPVGSMVTDVGTSIWERCRDGWTIVGGGSSSEDISWSVVRKYAPLRPTTDADRERVGLPVSGDLQTANEEVQTANEGVDPDEALREAIVSLTRRLHEADARAVKAEAELAKVRASADEWWTLYDGMLKRHEALRADIVKTSEWPDFGAHSGVLRGLLRRDDKRGQSC